jgi:hypothetical protein
MLPDSSFSWSSSPDEIYRLFCSFVLADKRPASSFLKNSGKSARNKKAELNHDGSCVNDLGLRSVSDVNAAIKAGLADAERHTDTRCRR